MSVPYIAMAMTENLSSRSRKKRKRAPILGRIAMNLTTVDVTDIPDVKAEDEVVLIGEQGDQIVRAEQIASLADTINYEVVARLSNRIPKVVVD